jgi:hypothetical protein
VPRRIVVSALLLVAWAVSPAREDRSLASEPAIQPDPAVVAGVEKLLDDSLTLLAEKSSDKDTQYYEKGLWHFTDKNMEASWPVQGGPGTAAAVLWRWRQRRSGDLDAAAKARQTWLHRVAIETFDRAIQDHQNPDGSFADRQKPDTHFFALELAMACLELGDSLPANVRRRWVNTLTAEVDYLIRHNELPNAALSGWYVNGNIELGKAEMVYLVWKITGQRKYKDLFEAQWRHTLSPDPRRWKGFGLVYVTQPAKADGSDGAGYLNESGGNAPGYDGDYAHLQLTVAARLYVESRDPRVLRLINLLVNALLPHVDRTTWVLDATHGSRHSLKFPFHSCGLAVAAWLGGRADLAPLLVDQFNKAIKPMYFGNALQNWGSPGIYRSYGKNVAVLLQAAALAGP